ncbi:hypothetical protein AVEN_200420-1 [Araneus ventricosus]|uniref:Uncharacterized protein n=1 Tax=Araneus ventricosus TaxID=182803 RepID=A0A4Y2QZX1_ARAVE|nr:hypothetical protein AVEN_200420-1 [Araneus ventricosus]
MTECVLIDWNRLGARTSLEFYPLCELVSCWTPSGSSVDPLGTTLELRPQCELGSCAQLTSFLARTADETLKSFPMDQRYYRWASSSLLARTADRTPKTFALQGDPSRSTHTPSSKRSPDTVSRGRP